MSTFQLMTEMFLLDNGFHTHTRYRDKLVELFYTEELETRAADASTLISIKGGDLPYMNDLYLLVHGESEEVRFLNPRHPELCEVLDKMWDLMDSDYFDKLDQETDNG